MRAVWDHLGLVIAVSLTWTLLGFLPLMLARVLPASLPALLRNACETLFVVLLLSAPLAGAFWTAHLVCIHEEVSYLDYWRGIGRLFGPATRLGLIHLVVFGLFAVNLTFYLRLGAWIGGLAALLCLYMLLLWGMMAVYHLPVLVAQEAGVFDIPDRRAKRGAIAVLRRAFFLALGDPFYTIGLLAVALLLTLLMAALAVPLALLWPGTIALLTTQATRALLVKYGVLSPPPPAAPKEEDTFRIADRPRRE